MKINDKNYILVCKRVFSHALQGVTSKVFPRGQSARPPYYSGVLIKKTVWHIYFKKAGIFLWGRGCQESVWKPRGQQPEKAWETLV